MDDSPGCGSHIQHVDDMQRQIEMIGNVHSCSGEQFATRRRTVPAALKLAVRGDWA